MQFSKVTAISGSALAIILTASCALSGMVGDDILEHPSDLLQAELVAIDAQAVSQHEIRAVIAANTQNLLAANLTWIGPEGDRKSGPVIQHTIIDHPNPPPLYAPLARALMQHSGLPASGNAAQQ